MPEVTVLAGPNGAGKSSAYTSLIRPEFAYLCADDEPGTAMEQGRAVIERMRGLEADEESFCIEMTLAGRNVSRWVERWQMRGYTTRLLYIALPSPDLAIARVRQRVAHGRHDIPGGATIIARRYWRGLANFHRYRDLFDTWTLYDNRDDRDGLVTVATGEVLAWSQWHELRNLSVMIGQ